MLATEDDEVVALQVDDDEQVNVSNRENEDVKDDQESEEKPELGPGPQLQAEINLAELDEEEKNEASI